MTQRLFTVTAHWDDEARIYYAESDIIGLHIEAETLDDFEAVLMEVGPGLIVANHIPAQALETQRPEELIPTIVWKRPQDKAA